MGINYSSVNFKNLIQDLADMYPFSVPEVVVTELIANSLDANATKISISYNKNDRVLTLEDNGLGMTKKGFDEYHDFAAGLKHRGSGIGFAGLGAKISFNVATRVITETYSSKFKGGSNWYLKSKKELVWEELKSIGSLNHKGTKVQVFFDEQKDIPFHSNKDLVDILIRHYLPLLDTEFIELYKVFGFHSGKLRFILNNKVIKPFRLEKKFSLQKVKKVFFKYRGKRYGYGIFGLTPEEFMVGGDIAGIGISVYGKFIKFDFLGQFPGEISPKIFGIAEIPPFVKFLNTSKTEFIRKRSTAKEYSKFLSPIREEFKSWLKEIGIKTIEAINTEDAIKLEREIKKIVEELPELSHFFGRSSKTKVLTKDLLGKLQSKLEEGAEETFPIGEGESNGENGLLDIGNGAGEALKEEKKGSERASPITRKKRSGIRISFADNPNRDDLAWLEENVIVINSSHPCYLKTRSNNIAKKLHNLFAIAISLNRELQLREILIDDEFFIDRMMSVWGKI